MEINRSKQQLLHRELRADESVIWVGEPDPMRAIIQSTPIFLGGLLFTIVALGFIRLLGSTGTWISGFPPAELVFSWSFALLGVALMLTPAWAYWNAKRSVYAITNLRALIIEGVISNRIQSFRTIVEGNITRKERGDGSGDLIFAQKRVSDGDGTSHLADIKFAAIPNVREVEDLLRSTLCARPRQTGAVP